MRKSRALLLSLLLLVVVGAALALALIFRKEQYRARLPDGSVFTLKQVTLTDTNISYAHDSLGPMVGRVVRVLPDFIARKFQGGSGSFGFGSHGDTNLVLVTVLRHGSGRPSPSGVHRLRVSDGTNTFDACWGAHTLGFGSETVNGWQVRCFPRRAPELILEFLSMGSSPAEWTVAARFKIPNPAAGDFSQWTPGPNVQTNGNLAVHLAKFQSGMPMDLPPKTEDPKMRARKTEMLFTFAEEGRPTEDWQVQKVTISDASGNHWFPYLNLAEQSFSWARDGQVEFFGALWPGEFAWKIDLEAVRTRNLPPPDLFTLEIPLPAPATVRALTNVWEHEGVTLKLIGLASPNTDHPGGRIWTGKWWGEQKDEVYSLVVELLPDRKGQRLKLLSAIDQTGAEAKLVEHRGQDDSQQAFFFKPAPEAGKLTLAFSMTSGRFVQFVARPDFPAQP